jgi:23S rRNA-intervening sequence protein
MWVKDFRELKDWQKAHELTLAVYQVTAGFPREELFGLTAQIRRAGSSIAANLAEGCGRNGDAELARFSSIAYGLGQRVGISSSFGERSETHPGPRLRGAAPPDQGVEAHADGAHAKAERWTLIAESSAIKISSMLGYS